MSARVGADLRVVPCSLWEKAGGSYPTDLRALVPGYLDHPPTGVMDGTPLRYTLVPGERDQLAARLPLLETERPVGSMVQGNDLVWHYQ